MTIPCTLETGHVPRDETSSRSRGVSRLEGAAGLHPEAAERTRISDPASSYAALVDECFRLGLGLLAFIWRRAPTSMALYATHNAIIALPAGTLSYGRFSSVSFFHLLRSAGLLQGRGTHIALVLVASVFLRTLLAGGAMSWYLVDSMGSLFRTSARLAEMGNGGRACLRSALRGAERRPRIAREEPDRVGRRGRRLQGWTAGFRSLGDLPALAEEERGALARISGRPLSPPRRARAPVRVRCSGYRGGSGVVGRGGRERAQRPRPLCRRSWQCEGREEIDRVEFVVDDGIDRVRGTRRGALCLSLSSAPGARGRSAGVARAVSGARAAAGKREAGAGRRRPVGPREA